ncbi:hypothetical protein EVA_16932 [gut metagenome]|uniref:Uncharacterized protein n=1 Tax=gut metagenome TaxID=749906 RepID=J9G633_9ZZZZ
MLRTSLAVTLHSISIGNRNQNLLRSGEVEEVKRLRLAVLKTLM